MHKFKKETIKNNQKLKEQTSSSSLDIKHAIEKPSYGNLFHIWPQSSPVRRIALTGVFLSLVILFQYLQRFMPFGNTFLKFNFTLLFILPIFYFAGPLFGIFSLVFRFAIGPAFSDLGYSPQGLVGHFVLFFATSVCIFFMYIFSIIFWKTKNRNVQIILISISTVLATSILLTFLNAIFFTPLYWYAYKYINSFSIYKAEQIYDGIKVKFFGIPNYWAGIFGTILPFNLIKFSLVYVVYFPLNNVFRQYAKRYL